MNVANLTAIVLAIAAICSAIVTPVYLNHRKEKKHAATKAIEAARKDAQTEEVSWEAISTRLDGDRERAERKVEVQRLAHLEEVAQLRTAHRAEIAQIREQWAAEAAEVQRRYDDQIAGLSQRLQECQTRVAQLYEERYEMQKRLPPPTN